MDIMKIKDKDIEGKYFLVRKIGDNIDKDKVLIKRKKKSDRFLLIVKYPFGERKYECNRAQVAEHIQKGDLIQCDKKKK